MVLLHELVPINSDIMGNESWIVDELDHIRKGKVNERNPVMVTCV